MFKGFNYKKAAFVKLQKALDQKGFKVDIHHDFRLLFCKPPLLIIRSKIDPARSLESYFNG